MNSLKNCSRKILVWWCGQLKRVTFFPVSSCQLHVRKREEKKKKITALQLLCVCVLYYRDQKKAPFLQKSRGESYSSYSSCSISTILVLYSVNCYFSSIHQSYFLPQTIIDTVYAESFCVKRKNTYESNFCLKNCSRRKQNVLVIDNHQNTVGQNQNRIDLSLEFS